MCTTAADAAFSLLCAVGDTRFATNFIMLDRVVLVWKELQQTVVDEKWDIWVGGGDNRVQGGAGACKAAVMDDRWLVKVKELLKLVQ